MLSTLERQIAWRGPLFSVEVLRLRDEQGREHQREIVRHPGAVAVVPVLYFGLVKHWSRGRQRLAVLWSFAIVLSIAFTFGHLFTLPMTSCTANSLPLNAAP